MFSKELENLIEATLADGILEEHEKAALVKRAQKEGVDLDELEIYIQSIMQKQVQNQRMQIERETAAHEKERRGNRCPHCNTIIPPMTKICPNCGQAVNSNETSGDKELFNLVDKISAASVKVKSATDENSFKLAKAECESLLRKADMFYGENKKIQMLVFDLKEEIQTTEQKVRKQALKSGITVFFKSKWSWCIIEVIVAGIIFAYFSNEYNYWDAAIYKNGGDLFGYEGDMKGQAFENKMLTVVIAFITVLITAIIAFIDQIRQKRKGN